MRVKKKVQLVWRETSIYIGLGALRLVVDQEGEIRPTSTTSLLQCKSCLKNKFGAQNIKAGSQFHRKELIQTTSPRTARLRFLLLQVSAPLVNQIAKQRRKNKPHRKDVKLWVAWSRQRSLTTSFQSRLVATKAALVWLPQARTSHTLQTPVSSSHELSNDSICLLKKTKKILNLCSCLT